MAEQIPRWEQQSRAAREVRHEMVRGSLTGMKKALEKLRPLLPIGIDVFIVDSTDPMLVMFVKKTAERFMPKCVLLVCDYAEVQGNFEGGWKAKVIKTRDVVVHLPFFLPKATKKTEFGPYRVL